MFFKIINRRYIRTRVIQFVYSNSVLEGDLDRSILNFRNSISSSLDLLYCSIDLINETKNHFLSIQTTKQSFKVILDNPYFKFLSDLKIPKKRGITILMTLKKDLFKRVLEIKIYQIKNL